MSADDVVELPRAFSGQRLDWRDLPAHVRRRIADLAGSQVSAETSATSGFSPGFVAVLELADGSAVFVKAVSPHENPASPELARAEIRIARSLPDEVPAPALLWWHDDGEWVVTGWEAVHGRTPQIPWRPEELTAVLTAVGALGELRPRHGHTLAATPEVLADDFTGWQRLAAAPQDSRSLLADGLGELGRWALGRMDALVRWEGQAPPVLAGDHLVHGDLRSDNLMLDDHHRVWIIDWPHASVGAPWLDLAFLLPSVAAEGGGDAATVFAAQPLAQDVPADHLRAALVGLAGYFAWSSLQPDPPGIPNLRRFQSAQAGATLLWLQTLA
ncbi:MAG: aminoglycoside phosphotransferase family protein [Cellulomonas sp.]|nr:aminoglycoside phosphotransferase family protein [Cellulomonas sp.]